MAVEQRIGRIHRYGQEETVQVYNLLAQDTVEEQIYGLLDQKLLEIARSIGKTDGQGKPLEDFRSDILGYLGSRPDYQDLYKRALVDRDYRRTDAEIKRMMEEALRAREALDSLTQDLGHFNLEHYRKLEGRYSLSELGEWVRTAILKLGGALCLPVSFGRSFARRVCSESTGCCPNMKKSVLIETSRYAIANVSSEVLGTRWWMPSWTKLDLQPWPGKSLHLAAAPSLLGI